MDGHFCRHGHAFVVFFFVLLLSFAQQSEEKFRDALGSLKGAFGVKEVRAVSEEMAQFNTSSEAIEKMASSISHDQHDCSCPWSCASSPCSRRWM